MKGTGVFLWVWDDGNSKWIPAASNEDGALKVSMADYLDIIPKTDSTYDIGSATKQFLRLFVDRIIITDGAGNFLQLPKLTTTQRNALTAVNGMMIYNTTTTRLESYENGAWGATATILHAATHTDGTDDIQESSTSQKGICQLDDTPVNGELNEPITSNWAYDHLSAADPHTGYVKESEFTAAEDILVGTGAGALVKKTPAEIMAILSGEATAGFSFNDNNLTDVNQIRFCDAENSYIRANNLVTAATERDLIFNTLNAAGNAWVEVLRLNANGTTPTLDLAMNMAVAALKTVDGRDISVDGTKLDTIATNADVTATAGAVMDADFTAADEVMVGTGGGTHNQITLAASQILGKLAAGATVNVTMAQLWAILSGAAAAAVNMNAQALTNIGAITSAGDVDITLGAEENLTIDAETNPRTHSLGTIHIDHKPGISGTRCFTLNIDVNSIADTLGIAIEYLATAMAAGESGIGIDVTVDTINASGGEVQALVVSKVGVGTLEVAAIHAGPGVLPIRQESGSFGAADNVEKTTDESAFTAITTASEMFSADNDFVYLGHSTTFNEVEWLFNTVASGAGIKPEFYFSTGAGTWTKFGPNDSTNGCRTNGVLEWEIADISGTWALATYDAVSKYWIKIKRTAANLTTKPVLNTMKLVSATMYSWDETGDVNVKDFTAANIITAGNVDGRDVSVDGAKLDGIAAGAIANVIEDTSPQLGGHLDLNKKSIRVNENLLTNLQRDGIFCLGVYGDTLVFGELIYLNTTDQRWEKALANAEATSGDVMLGIALESGSDGDSSKTILLWGYIHVDAFNFTSYGQALFIDASTGGDMTQTAPAASGNIVRVVGYAHDDADTIFFNPSNTWLEIA